eukprot:2874191-Amphidinium_carterae.1
MTPGSEAQNGCRGDNEILDHGLGWCVKPMTPTLQVLKCGESCTASLLDLGAKMLNKSGLVNQHRGVQVRA